MLPTTTRTVTVFFTNPIHAPFTAEEVAYIDVANGVVKLYRTLEDGSGCPTYLWPLAEIHEMYFALSPTTPTPKE